MTLNDLSFIFFAGITLLGAFWSVTFKRVFYNALGLGLSFFGLAGLYIFLYAEYIAMLQIIVYIGAISIAIVFAIMLSDSNQIAYPSNKARVFLSSVFSIILFGLGCYLISRTNWPVRPFPENLKIMENIGYHLLGRYVLSFELISLVLLVAILGALVISRKKAS